MDAPPDPRSNFAAAFGQTQEVLDQVGPDDLDRPTPCEDFDVRTLVAHLLGVAGRIDHVGRGGHFADAPSILDGIDPADASAELASRRAAAIATWSDDALLTQTFTVAWGDVPGFAVLGGYVQELTIHSWDLAQAIGVADLDPALAEACLPVARMFVPAEVRGGDMPFGPVVDVPADADPYEQLAGWLGRRPLVTT